MLESEERELGRVGGTCRLRSERLRKTVEVESWKKRQEDEDLEKQQKSALLDCRRRSEY